MIVSHPKFDPNRYAQQPGDNLLGAHNLIWHAFRAITNVSNNLHIEEYKRMNDNFLHVLSSLANHPSTNLNTVLEEFVGFDEPKYSALALATRRDNIRWITKITKESKNGSN